VSCDGKGLLLSEYTIISTDEPSFHYHLERGGDAGKPVSLLSKLWREDSFQSFALMEVVDNEQNLNISKDG